MANKKTPMKFGSAFPMGGPGMSLPVNPFPVDQEALGSLLDQFHVQMPAMRQGPIFPESGPTWFGQHPQVSTGINNALLALAGFQGGDTIGENISGAARSFINIPAMRQQLQMAPMMQALGTAGQIGGLMKAAQGIQEFPIDIALKKSQTIENLARGALYDYQRGRPTPQQLEGYVWDDQGRRWASNQTTGTMQHVPLPGERPYREGIDKRPTFKRASEGKEPGGTAERATQEMWDAMSPEEQAKYPGGHGKFMMEKAVILPSIQRAIEGYLGLVRAGGRTPEATQRAWETQRKAAEAHMTEFRKGFSGSKFDMQPELGVTEEAFNDVYVPVSKKAYGTFQKAWEANPDLTWEEHLQNTFDEANMKALQQEAKQLAGRSTLNSPLRTPKSPLPTKAPSKKQAYWDGTNYRDAQTHEIIK